MLPRFFTVCLALLAAFALLAPAVALAQNTPSGVHIEVPPTPDTPNTAHFYINETPHLGPAPVFYIDGQRRDSTALSALNPNDIESISVLKGFNANQLGSNEGKRGVLLIVTKAGQHTRAVHAFNRRLKRLARRAATNTTAH